MVLIYSVIPIHNGDVNTMGFYSLFAGKMLGDGYMNLTRGAPRFVFLHASKDRDYAKHCFDLFSSYIKFGEKCSKESSVYDKRTNKYYGRVYYQSKTDSVLKHLYTLWYREKRKVIPMEWVSDNLEPDGLALWYQDDGCLKNKLYRTILSTENFEQGEIQFLKDLLRNKFRINSQIDIQGRIDISTRKEIRKFQALVEPHIHPSMDRKSMRTEWEKWTNKWQQIGKEHESIVRTSIYLPNELYNVMKGQGYSLRLNQLLDQWLEIQWTHHIIKPDKRYKWILDHENIQKGRFLITPRLKPHIKKKLDLMSIATGFEISELVIIALAGNASE